MGVDDNSAAGGTILYVEDDSQIRQLLADMLARQYPNMDLLVAENGAMGLELFDRQHPQVVLTDLRMPVMDGLQMAAAIRRRNPSTFLVAVSAYSDPELLQTAMEIGFHGYVLKPVETGKLFAVIDACLETCRTRQRLQSMENRVRQLSQVVDESPVAVVMTTSGGDITYVNPGFTRMTGFTPEEVVGRQTPFLRPETLPGELVVLQPGELATGNEWRGEILSRRKDNSFYWAETTVFPLHDEVGDVAGYAAMATDITDRKRAEALLKANNAELEAANSELETFSYTVAHDLRTTLQWIGGFSRGILAASGDQLDERSRHYLAEIVAGAEQMERLVDSLLSFSCLSHKVLQREPVDLAEVARRVADELARTDPTRRVAFLIAPRAEVAGDRILLRSVLQNLMENAWKYTAGQEDAAIEFGTVDRAGTPICFVRDNGIGFDMDQRERLFTPFCQINGRGEGGMGIGLATVHRIIQRHGGRVWTDGAQGKGATFYFTVAEEG